MNQKISNSPLLPSFLLLLVALIWGGGFITTAFAINAGISTALLLTIRFSIPAVIMGIIFSKELAILNKDDVKFGFNAGIILFLAFFCQIYGIKFTSPANNAFLTSTNVIMVPFLSWIFLHQKTSIRSIICAFTCFIGTAILSWSPGIGITFNLGDCLTLMCAFLFACHYAYLGISATRIRSAAVLSFLQIFVVAVLSLFTFLLFERDLFSIKALKSGMWSILYLAFLSTGFCYFVQCWAQRRFSASGTAIILSTEGLFGSAFSVIYGFDKLTTSLVVGGSIILVSVIMIQVDFNEIKRLLFKKSPLVNSENSGTERK